MKREEAPERAAFPYFSEITTRWMDQDPYGHVNNVEYYSYFDTAVNRQLIENAGLDPRTTDVVGMVVDTQCSFFRELTFPEVVSVGVRVAKLGRTSIQYEIGIFRDGEKTCPPPSAGSFTSMWIARRMSPTPLPDRILAAVKPLVVPAT